MFYYLFNVFTFLEVTDLKNTSFAHNQVDIVWNPTNGSRYCGSDLIYYNISISNGGDITNKITTRTTATIDGLMSNTTYIITVAAFIMDIGEGIISDPLFITTAARENSGEGLCFVYISFVCMYDNSICNTLHGQINGKFCATNLM